jgi:hypothetical protein
MIEAKAFRIFIRVHSLFKSERLSANIKLTMHKALIRTITTYACCACGFAVDNHLLRLQHLQNKVLRTTGNFPKHTRVRDLHMALKLLYVYDYITKLCRQQAEVIQNHENAMFTILDKTEPDTENIRGLNLAAVKHETVQVNRLPL